MITPVVGRPELATLLVWAQVNELPEDTQKGGRALIAAINTTFEKIAKG